MAEPKSSAGEVHLDLAEIIGYTTSFGLENLHGKN
jgi:hypothetical protein